MAVFYCDGPSWYCATLAKYHERRVCGGPAKPFDDQWSPFPRQPTAEQQCQNRAVLKGAAHVGLDQPIEVDHAGDSDHIKQPMQSLPAFSQPSNHSLRRG